MQRIALILFFTTIMSESLCAQVTGLGSRGADEDDRVGLTYPLNGGGSGIENVLQGGSGGNTMDSDDLLLTPLMLRKLLLISRLQQENTKRSHYKQCAFNAVSCFG